MTKVLAILSITPDYEEFGIPELKSILRPMNIPLKILLKYEIEQFPQHEYQINYKSFRNYPFIVLNIPDFESHRAYLNKAALNAVMLTKLVQVIGQGSSYEDMLNTYDQQIVKKQLDNWDTRVLCHFYSRNRSIQKQEQRNSISKVLQNMNTKGKVDLQNPEKVLILGEDHSWFQNHHQLQPKQTLKNVYFGLELSSNRPLKGGAKFNQKYELSNRIYLGPTTTDNDVSFLMCRQALIDDSSFVLDPFVGTGSLLIPPSHYGAYVFGSDLDIRVLNGYSVGQINKRSKYYQKQKQFQIFTPKIMLNFIQYQLKQPQIFRMDCLKGRFRAQGMFDAIICDPPYGIRAMSRKINHKNTKSETQHEKKQKQQSKQLINEQGNSQEHDKQRDQSLEQSNNKKQQQLNDQNIVQQEPTSKQLSKKMQLKRIRKQKKKQRSQALTEQQKQFKQQIKNKFSNEVKKWEEKPTIQCTPKDEIYNGLLNFAAQYLKPNGYLVFLYPILFEQDFQNTGDELPKHLEFQLIDFSTHKMKQGNVRVLITMRKISKQ